MVGPSFALVVLLLLLPLGIAVCLALYMLFDWRRFRALIFALLAFAAWLGLASVTGLFGVFMFVLSGVACLVFVVGALWLNHITSTDSYFYKYRRAAANSPGPDLTRCSSCHALIARDAAICPSCRTTVSRTHLSG